MRRFTIDAETIELPAEECAAFGRLVDDLCVSSKQRDLSAFLAAVTRPQLPVVADVGGAVAARMWRG